MKRKQRSYPYEYVKMVCENSGVMANKFPDQMWMIKHIIDRVLRRLVDIQKPIYVSKAALAKAKKMGIDLKKLTWHAQPDVDPGRTIFHLEHCHPLSELSNRIICGETFDVIRKDNFTAWILKSEDNKLNKNGFRNKRPGGWKKCYKICGIEVVKL